MIDCIYLLNQMSTCFLLRSSKQHYCIIATRSPLYYMFTVFNSRRRDIDNFSDPVEAIKYKLSTFFIIIFLPYR